MFGTASSSSSQHQLDQWSRTHRAARGRNPASRQYADIGPFEPEMSREGLAYSAGSGEIPLETRENPLERAEAAGQQTMRMPVLRSARAGEAADLVRRSRSKISTRPKYCAKAPATTVRQFLLR